MLQDAHGNPTGRSGSWRNPNKNCKMLENSNSILLDICLFLEISPLALHAQSVQNLQKKTNSEGTLEILNRTKENWRMIRKKLWKIKRNWRKVEGLEKATKLKKANKQKKSYKKLRTSSSRRQTDPIFGSRVWGTPSKSFSLTCLNVALW